MKIESNEHFIVLHELVMIMVNFVLSESFALCELFAPHAPQENHENNDRRSDHLFCRIGGGKAACDERSEGLKRVRSEGRNITS